MQNLVTRKGLVSGSVHMHNLVTVLLFYCVSVLLCYTILLLVISSVQRRCDCVLQQIQFCTTDLEERYQTGTLIENKEVKVFLGRFLFPCSMSYFATHLLSFYKNDCLPISLKCVLDSMKQSICATSPKVRLNMISLLTKIFS